MPNKVKTKHQRGGVNIGRDAKAKGDIVGGSKITVIGTGAVIIAVIAVAALALLLPVINKPPVPPAPTPTALAFQSAGQDETLLIVADFDDRSAGQYTGIDPAQRTYELITNKLPGSNMKLRVEQYHHPLKDSAEARRVLNAYGATLMIWGWYDKLGAEPNVELDKERIALSNPQMHEVSLATPESFVMKFTQEIPSQSAYVAFLSLGMMQLDLDRVAAAAFFTQAIDSASQVGADSVNPWEALMWRGNMYFWSNERDLAIADYTEALKLHPQREGYFDRGASYGSQGKHAEAIADYTQAITMDHKYKEAYVGRGRAYGAQGKYAEAIADYTQAIALDPVYAMAYLGRGNVYWAQGKYDEAIADYTHATAIDDKYKEAYTARGLAYEALGKHDEAIADYTRAIAIDAKYAEAYAQRGLVYNTQGKYELAIADYTEAVNISSDFAGYYTGRGNVYADRKKYKDAIADYQKSLDLDPSAYTYCVLGITFTKIGDFPSAIVALEQGVKLDTKSENPWCKTTLDNARLGTPTP